MQRISVLALALMLSLVAPSAAEVPVPEQVHVTLGEEPGTLVVHWAVSVAYPASEDPQVAWQAGEQSAVAAAELVGEVEPRAVTGPVPTDPPHPTYIYAAPVGPVPNGTEVTYSVGSETRGTAGPFTTAVPSGQSLRFVAFGDIGVDRTAPDGSAMPGIDRDAPALVVENPAHLVRDRAIAEEPHLVIIPGDLAYDNTRDGWDSFMRFLEPLISTAPMMASMGNHEYEDDIGYAQALAEFVLPGNEQEFLFRAGPVTFIALNSDTICGPHQTEPSGTELVPCETGRPDQEQLGRVETLLQEAEDDATQWTVVFFHHPAYSFGSHGDHFIIQHLWVPLFEEYGVDVVLNAHDHLYSRSHPILQGEPVANGTHYRQGDGIVYVVTGGGGRGLYQQPDTEPPAWWAAGGEYHHLTVWDVNETHLHAKAVLPDGTVVDEWGLDAATPAFEAGPDDAETPGLPVAATLALLALILRRRT